MQGANFTDRRNPRRVLCHAVRRHLRESRIRKEFVENGGTCAQPPRSRSCEGQNVSFCFAITNQLFSVCRGDAEFAHISPRLVSRPRRIPEEAKPVMSLLNGRVKIDTEGLQRGAESVVSEGARAVSAAAAAASDAASAVQKAFKAPPRHMSAFSVEGGRS